MPRPRLRRRIASMPSVTYFKPAGIMLSQLGETIITVDEFEAVRLKDLLGLDQEEAAKKMNISQPTFHRLVLSARKKIAQALVEGKAIKIEGGSYKMMPIQPGAGRGRRGMGGRGAGFGGPAQTCVCSACGFQKPKVRGLPCIKEKCPKCGAPMIRG